MPMSSISRIVVEEEDVDLIGIPTVIEKVDLLQPPHYAFPVSNDKVYANTDFYKL